MKKKSTINIIDLESIETRYTKSWKTFIPEKFENLGYEVVVIEPPPGWNNKNHISSPGGFLNFIDTNSYKAGQVESLVGWFHLDQINDNDIFLFTDAWHFGVIALKYMLDLMGSKARMAGMWHAGSYSKNDPLDQVNMGRWADDFERSVAKALDYNFFATHYHMEDFINKRHFVGIENKCHATGFPFDFSFVEDYFEYIIPWNKRENIIVFPHRDSKERNPWIVDWAKRNFPDYKVIKTLEITKNKDEYYRLLCEGKFTLSFSDNENWGISCFESFFLGCMPIVNNNFSYVEMYPKIFRYGNLAELKHKIRNFHCLNFNKDEKEKIAGNIKDDYCNGIFYMDKVFEEGF